MGMFDRIKCEFELAEKEFQNNEFQTKDLDCELNNYLITKEGRLILISDKGNTDLEFHGDLIFYDYIANSLNNKEWHEFKARFTEGKLQWIRRISA